ncbi:hypothetical protein SB775_27495 [Peribacillus sp. SIMBA_075]|uniref:hypothetical protein n=1 Tax=Peribacillus sp. SIMBA_075 TaxID=3085813 RepID=UPI00397E4574
MSARLYEFRPFQTVRDLGKQSGINPAGAINAIRDAQEHGQDGRLIAGRFRERCWRVRNGYTPTDPKGAA